MPEAALTPADVHVWTACLDAPLGESDELSAQERAELARMLGRRARQQRACARVLLRRVLASYVDCLPAEVPLVSTPRGKPTLGGAFLNEDLAFNASHTDERWLLAVGRRQALGVDVERIRADFPVTTVARTALSAREHRAWRELAVPLRREGFFACWTRKEAFVKATGEGLHLPLASFDVTVHPAEPARLLACRTPLGIPTPDWIQDLPAAAGYRAALAGTGHAPRITMRPWPP